MRIGATLFGFGLIASLAGFSSVAKAATITTTCPPMGTFDQFLTSGFSCVVDNVRFDNFTFSSSSGLTAAEVSVQPVAPTGGLYFPFSPNLTVSNLSGGNPASAQFTIGMNLTALGSANIAGLSLDTNGTGTNGGGSSVTANLCLGQDLAGCPAGDSRQLTIANSGFNSVSFDPVQALGLSFSTSVNSGSQGTGTLAQFEFGVIPGGGTAGGSTGTGTTSGGPGGSPVPEPSTWLMFAGACAGLLVCRKTLGASV